jgi:hypothetical protein
MLIRGYPMKRRLRNIERQISREEDEDLEAFSLRVLRFLLGLKTFV